MPLVSIFVQMMTDLIFYLLPYIDCQGVTLLVNLRSGSAWKMARVGNKDLILFNWEVLGPEDVVFI